MRVIKPQINPETMTLTSQQAALLLCCIPNLGPRRIKKLIDQCNGARNVLQSPAVKLLEINGIGPSHLKYLRQWKQYLTAVKKEEKRSKEQGLELFIYGEENYPLALTHTADPPIVFFQKGKVNWKNPRVISIVGTRTPTVAGIRLCEALLVELAPYNPLIISGFARGIDISAHKKAIELGLETVAVLGHSFGQWYPASHSKYVKSLLKQGAFLTEFWSEDPFERTNFLKRNRIIAGVAHATVVIESAREGGSLVTADHALAYGREVFAFPGRPTDPKSAGCLRLIKNDQARLIRHGKDLIQWMNWEEKKTKRSVQKPLFLDLSEREKQLFSCLAEAATLDEVSLKCKLPIATTAALLLQLELKGAVRSIGGNKFERC